MSTLQGTVIKSPTRPTGRFSGGWNPSKSWTQWRERSHLPFLGFPKISKFEGCRGFFWGRHWVYTAVCKLVDFTGYCKRSGPLSTNQDFMSIICIFSLLLRRLICNIVPEAMTIPIKRVKAMAFIFIHLLHRWRQTWQLKNNQFEDESPMKKCWFSKQPLVLLEANLILSRAVFFSS